MNENIHSITDNEFDIMSIDENLFVYAGPKAEENEKITSKPYSYWKTVGKILFKNKIFIGSLLILVVILLLAFIVPIGKVAYPLDADNDLAAPSWNHLFGIGLNKEDYFTTIWCGARKTIIFALIISAIQVCLGIILGSIWGFYKKLDILFIESTRFLTLIPTLILWLMVIFVFRMANVQSNMWVIVLAISLTSWIGIAETIRVQIILVRNTEYNIASKALGSSGRKIITRNIFPKILPIIIQTASFTIPEAIAIDSTLSYFNFGFVDTADRTSTSLGYILNTVLATSSWEIYPHLLFIPVALIVIISALFFLAGKIFADSLDPKSHR